VVDVIRQLPLPGIESSPFNPGEIWATVTLAAVNQTSIWETCKDTDNTPCDDTVMDWLHTLNREWLERIANDLLKEMAMTILDPTGRGSSPWISSITLTTGLTPMRTANSVGCPLKTVQ